MTLKQAITTAVHTQNGVMLARIIDKLRSHGLNYAACAEMFEKHAGIDADTFEGLMWIADHAESNFNSADEA